MPDGDVTYVTLPSGQGISSRYLNMKSGFRIIVNVILIIAFSSCGTNSDAQDYVLNETESS